MSNAKVIPYQDLLLDQNSIRFPKTSALNPANFLLDDDPTAPSYDCLEVTDLIQSVRPDLSDILLVTPDEVLFMYGRSFIQNRIRNLGELVVTQDKTI